MKKKYVASVLICFMICILSFTQAASAVNYDQKIKEAEKEQKSLEQKTEKLQEDMKEIQESRNDTMLYIEKLDKKTSQLEEELNSLEGRLGKAEKELEKIQEELAAVEAEEEKQYTTMKKRIKYMYENGNQVYIEILFGAKSIPDLLNRSEYVSKITDYDKTIFQKYQEIILEVQKKEQQHQTKVKELEDLKTQKKEEKQAVKELKADKKKELEKYNQKIEKSQDKIDEYTKKAIAAENEVEKLLQQKQEEIEREMAAGGGNSGGNEGGLEWPLRGGAGRLSSGFGPRHSPTAGASSYHKGIDLAIASGTPILAVGTGKVVTATYSSSAGNYVMISHGNRLYSVYMHCSRLAVKVGDKVSKGQVIAYVGSTGISTGAHLHFGISKNGSYVNPLNYISR